MADGRHISKFEIRNSNFELDKMFSIIRSEPDRLVVQIVKGADQANGFALGPHQNRTGDRSGALRFHPAQQGAVTDPGRAENNVFALGEIVSGINFVQILFPTVGDQLFLFLLVPWPHFRLHFAAETFDSCGSEHRFR